MAKHEYGFYSVPLSAIFEKPDQPHQLVTTYKKETTLAAAPFFLSIILLQTID